MVSLILVLLCYLRVGARRPSMAQDSFYSILDQEHSNNRGISTSTMTNFMFLVSDGGMVKDRRHGFLSLSFSKH